MMYLIFRFWTLTANPDAYRHQAALELAHEKRLSPEGVSELHILFMYQIRILTKFYTQLFYAFCMALGISPLDGTTSEVHMKDDMALMSRIRSGEQFFANKEELSIIGNALGTLEWNVEDEL
jgi:hypothetical protein